MLTLIVLVILAAWIAGAVWQLPGVARREAFDFEDKKQKALQWQADRMLGYNNAYDRWESLPTHRRGNPPQRPVEILGQLEAERKWDIAGECFKTLLWPTAPLRLAGKGAEQVWQHWQLEGVVNYMNITTRLAIENPKQSLRTQYNALADAIAQIVHKLPPTVHDILSRMDSQLQALVDYTTDPADTLVLENVMGKYLTDTLDTFVAMPAVDRHEPKLVNALISQLQTIKRPLDEMTGTIGSSQVQEFQINGRFLDDRFPARTPTALEL